MGSRCPAIQSASITDDSILIELHGSEQVRISLFGYTDKTRAELKLLLRARAELQPHPAIQSLYIRSAAPLPPEKDHPVLLPPASHP